MADRLTGFVGRDMAVDLGTANTLIYVRGQGIVLNEPSVVAIDVHDRRPLAVGTEAKRMIGRTPSHIQAVRPLKDGVISDFDICEKMLRYFIHKVHHRRWVKPRMVIAVPSGITGVEQRAVLEAAEYAGARKPAHIIEEPMAAALGADLPVALDMNNETAYDYRVSAYPTSVLINAAGQVSLRPCARSAATTLGRLARPM